MKKNFFKKLSFVMALAMIISVIAPAAGAFAATKSSLNATSKVLYLGTKNNKFDFNIKNHVKGSKYSWTIADAKVATVHKTYGMVTAKGVGSTKVTVKVTPKTGKAYSLSAKVIVRDNIKTVTISDLPKEDLKVGQEHDFNRTFTTVSGGSRTLSVTRWLVAGEGATIDEKSGVFKAETAGEYKITAVSFETDAKFAAWKKDGADVTKALAYDEYTVKVVPSIVDVKQVDADTFTVEFDSDMSKTDVKTASVLYQVIGGKNVSTGAEKIKTVTLDSTGKIATIDMFTAFNAGSVYNYVYGDLKDSFTAATKNITDIAGIVFDDFTVTIGSGKDMLKEIYAVNKDGVKILTGTEISGYLTFTYGGDKTKGNNAANMLYIYTPGYSTPVTVKFTNHYYDADSKTFKTVTFESAATATGITGNELDAASIQFEVVNDTDPAKDGNWDGTKALAAKDPGYRIRARYLTNTTGDKFQYTNDNSKFVYESSDTSKLLITGTYVNPIAAGTVTVLVKDATDLSKTITTFDIVISPSRAFASATPDVSTVQIGNNAAYGEDGKVTITTLDSLGDALTAGASAATVNKPANAGNLSVSLDTTTTKGKVFVTINAKNAVAGAYNVKVTLTAYGTTQDVYLAVLVVEGNTAATKVVQRWDVQTDATTVDLKANYKKDVNVNVYGLNSNGVRVDKLDFGTDFTVSVVDSKNVEVASNSVIKVVTPVSGASVIAMDEGSYTIIVSLTAKGIADHFPNSGRVAPSYLGGATLNVINTTTKSYKLDNATVSTGTALDIAKEAYTAVLEGKDLDDSAIVGVTYNTGTGRVELKDGNVGTAIAAGTHINIESITFKVLDPATTNNTGSYIYYTVTTGQTLVVK